MRVHPENAASQQRGKWGVDQSQASQPVVRDAYVRSVTLVYLVSQTEELRPGLVVGTWYGEVSALSIVIF